MGRRWEIEISDAKGRWGCPPLFKQQGPGVYVTTYEVVAKAAEASNHVYARELAKGEAVKEEHDEPPEETPSKEPLSVLDLRPQTVKLKTCEHCDRQYKHSHKRCAKRDKAEVEAAKKPKPKVEKTEEEPELNPRIAPIIPEPEKETDE